MKKNKLINAVGEIGEDLIEEVASYTRSNTVKNINPTNKNLIWLSASLVATVVLAVGVVFLPNLLTQNSDYTNDSESDGASLVDETILYSEFFEFGMYKATPVQGYEDVTYDDDYYHVYASSSEGWHYIEVEHPYSAFAGLMLQTSRVKLKLKVESLGYDESTEKNKKWGIYQGDKLLVVLTVYLGDGVSDSVTKGVLFEIMHEDGFALLPGSTNYHTESLTDEERLLEELTETVQLINLYSPLETWIFNNYKYDKNDKIPITLAQLNFIEDLYLYDDELIAAGYDGGLVVPITELERLYNDIFAKNAESVVFAPEEYAFSITNGYIEIRTDFRDTDSPLMILTESVIGDNTVTLTFTTGIYDYEQEIITDRQGEYVIGDYEITPNGYITRITSNIYEKEVTPEMVKKVYDNCFLVDYTFVKEDGKYKIQSIKLNQAGGTTIEYVYYLWNKMVRHSEEFAVGHKIGSNSVDYKVEEGKKGFDLCNWLLDLPLELIQGSEMPEHEIGVRTEEWWFYHNPGFSENPNFSVYNLNEFNGLRYIVFPNGDAYVIIQVEYKGAEWYRSKVIDFDINDYLS